VVHISHLGNIKGMMKRKKKKYRVYCLSYIYFRGQTGIIGLETGEEGIGGELETLPAFITFSVDQKRTRNSRRSETKQHLIKR